FLNTFSSYLRWSQREGIIPPPGTLQHGHNYYLRHGYGRPADPQGHKIHSVLVYDFHNGDPFSAEGRRILGMRTSHWHRRYNPQQPAPTAPPAAQDTSSATVEELPEEDEEATPQADATD
ncbi:MAG: hypothetical protein GY721_12340, partial [Deltaproteobacteria bacterium]|nr:hypothetical protein [Deltaproteobacteria bacterium]